MRVKRRNRLKIYGILAIVILLMVFGPNCRASAQTVSGNSVDADGNIEKEPPVKILLVGNSLTRFVFNRDGKGIQEHLERLAEASGKEVVIKTVAYGGTALKNYVGMNPKRKNQQRAFNRALRSQEWDYVIIQELSKLYYKNFEKNSVPAVRKMLRRIQKQVPDAQVMLYVPRGYDSVAKRANPQMSALQMECYMGAAGDRLASRFDIPTIPVGMHFYRCSVKYPDIRLLGPDKRKHPTRAGYFLTAACIYQKIFGEEPQISDEILEHAHISKKEAINLIQLWGEGISSDTVETVIEKQDMYTMHVTDAQGNPLSGVRFMSLDEAVAVVDDVTGEITALKSGMTVIMAETIDGWQAYCTVYVPYDVPENLRADATVATGADGQKAGVVKLKWKKQKGARYEVYRAESPEGPYTLQKQVKRNRYIDATATPDKTWYYKVKAVNDYKACSSKKTKAIEIELK